ncbi:MAG: hypothetical protein JW895_06355 [Thermoleophilaceae bacterium]|nr:hypothetical protein [Thermoleophilaceae bacterium]
MRGLALLAALVALAATPCAAGAQEPGAGAPDKLTERYPLGERLREPTDHADRGTARPGEPREQGPPLWPFVAIPLAIAVGLLALAVYARGGPPAAYGYAIDERPRPRREVSPEVLHALRGLLRYDRRRDAHVLRVVGHRVGPVLWAEPPRRTGRFDREDPRPAEREHASHSPPRGDTRRHHPS